MSGFAKALVVAGVVLIVVGLAWPWISKLGLGRLPGDVVVKREGFAFYFPITTMILVSVGLTILLRLFGK
ncbi:MAG: DUF2905 domain-containing protein [Pseudomonadota bacterium]